MSDDVVSRETYVGYVSKAENPYSNIEWAEAQFGETLRGMPTIWRTRGEKKLWGKEDWPPVKVRITVEVLK